MLARTVHVLLFSVLVIGVLHWGREFLIPVAFAGLFAMLFLPLSDWLEKKGWPRALAIVSCILILVAVIGGLVGLLAWQVSNFAEDMVGIKEQATAVLEKIRQYISSTLGITPDQQAEMLKKQQEGASGEKAKAVASVLSTLKTLLVDTILVLVYIFLFMYFHPHLKRFVLMLVPASDKPKTEKIILDASKVAQHYLAGVGMMIVALWVLYGIGFSIVGVKHALFFAVLCGLLEIVPFIGNLAGTAITLLVSIAQGGESSVIVGILIVYGTVQFTQTYILEPLVVGAEVNINPLFTILGLVGAEMVWGIPGLILAIPMLAIAKIICDHVEPLKPYGLLLGPPAGKKKESGLKARMRRLLGRHHSTS